jgi:aryl-alcohol dehydrogenase-like predicted oxidoreductase
MDRQTTSNQSPPFDLGINFLDTSASYGKGHNHGLIGEAIRGRRHDVVIHSKSGSPRDGSPDAVRSGVIRVICARPASRACKISALKR